MFLCPGGLLLLLSEARLALLFHKALLLLEISHASDTHAAALASALLPIVVPGPDVLSARVGDLPRGECVQNIRYTQYDILRTRASWQPEKKGRTAGRTQNII